MVLVFFLGAFLAYLLYRPVNWIEKKGIKRVWAILILYLLAGVLLATALYLIIPGMVKELTTLARLYPEYAKQVQDMLGRIDDMNMPGQLNELCRQNLGKIEKGIYAALNGFLSGIYIFMGKVLALVFSPILAFYMLNDWEKIRDVFLGLFTPSARREASLMGNQIDNVLIEFLKGHLMIASMVGLAVGLAAWILGVRFPLLIGVVVGICDLIPYFGPFLGAVPAVALALSQSLRLAIYITIAMVIIQQAESNLITPRIMSDRLGLHPLVIVFALLCGGKLLGIWGMLFAVPLAAVLKVILNRAYLWLIDY